MTREKITLWCSLREVSWHVVDSLVANKKIEWAAYRQQVTRFELDRYLGLL